MRALEALRDRKYSLQDQDEQLNVNGPCGGKGEEDSSSCRTKALYDASRMKALYDASSAVRQTCSGNRMASVCNLTC